LSAYYNENDPFAAAWLRELIKAGLIADGEVDERSIELVSPADVRGFTQCHFFAGIGGWSYALRLAGWPDTREVWTGSCPCQPFSSAGTQTGGHDPRDLWPVWFQLIRECRPVVVFGEQVEAAIGHGWLDRLCDDLEAEDYAVGACGLPGPCVGAYDIRQRLWFVADAGCLIDERRSRSSEASGTARSTQGEARQREWSRASVGAGSASSNVADAEGARGRADIGAIRERPDEGLRSAEGQEQRRPSGEAGRAGGSLAAGIMADPDGQRRTRERVLLRSEAPGWDAGEVSQTAWGGIVSDVADADGTSATRHGADRGASAPAQRLRRGSPDYGQLGDSRRAGLSQQRGERRTSRGEAQTGAGQTTLGAGASAFWADADWIPCTDGKARPVEPGTFPLASRIPNRVGRLRGYGNAIKPPLAAAFIEAYLTCSASRRRGPLKDV
jgi:DNA (cytosine-5)-methyltransferase 1